MTALDDSRAHLAKAEEFGDAAAVNFDGGFDSAATPNAVTSGINSKEAVCLRLTGTPDKTQHHRTAVSGPRAAGGFRSDRSSHHHDGRGPGVTAEAEDRVAAPDRSGGPR